MLAAMYLSCIGSWDVAVEAGGQVLREEARWLQHHLREDGQQGHLCSRDHFLLHTRPMWLRTAFPSEGCFQEETRVSVMLYSGANLLVQVEKLSQQLLIESTLMLSEPEEQRCEGDEAEQPRMVTRPDRAARDPLCHPCELLPV